MKKIQDIPKEDIFKVPDGYFDELPNIIQSRIIKRENQWLVGVRFSLKYALPAIVLITGLFWIFKIEPEQSPEQLLAKVNSVDIVEYLNESEISSYELMESIDYSLINSDSLNLIEGQILFNQDDINDILNEFEN